MSTFKTTDIYVSNNAHISGTLYTDSVEFEQLVVSSSVYFPNNLYVSGTSELKDLDVDTMYVSNNAYFSGTNEFNDVYVSGTLYGGSDGTFEVRNAHYYGGMNLEKDSKYKFIFGQAGSVNDSIRINTEHANDTILSLSGSSAKGNVRFVVGDASAEIDDVVFILSQSWASGADNNGRFYFTNMGDVPTNITDVFFFVSGAIGEKGSHGVALFGGDIMSSGSIKAYVSESAKVPKWPVFMEPATAVAMPSDVVGSSSIDIWNNAELDVGGPGSVGLITKFNWTADEANQQSASIVFEKMVPPMLPETKTDIELDYVYKLDTNGGSGGVKATFKVGSQDGSESSYEHIFDSDGSFVNTGTILNGLNFVPGSRYGVTIELCASGSATGSVGHFKTIF